ncbi:MAG: choice-of-anchor D domain-containing protein [Saprospiraceae bacterium]
MKKILFYLIIGFIVVCSTATNGQTSDLLISEYIEGSGNNKYLEIFNGTGNAINLSTYKVEIYSNGASTPTTTINLSGNLNNDDVFVIEHSSEGLGVNADLSTGSLNFNGDDAVALRKGSVLLDLIGNIGCDPGSEWGSGNLSTADNGIRREVEYCDGVTVDPNNSDCLFPSLDNSNWEGLVQDDVSGLGTHTATCISSDPTITHIGTTPAAADILQGSTNTILYQVEVEVSDGPATMTQLVAATGGTFDNDDLDNFKLWFSTDASFNSVSDVLLSTISDPTTGDQTFTVINQVFPVGTRYLFITSDVDAAATIGHTVSCAPDADGDFTYTEDETNSGSSFAAANAMTIVGVPELQLEYPVSTNLSCGGTIPFGDLAINDHADLTFRIRNIGTADLTFSTLSIVGPNPIQFSVQTQPVSPVAPGNFSDAVIRFSPTSIGAKTASITISNNDPDESSCLVNLTGTGRPVNDNCAGAITLTVESGETCNSPLSSSSTGASQSIAAIECNALTGNADDDVWFKFEATGTSQIITVDGASNMDAVVDLREGACNGTNLECADDTEGDGIEVITASGLTIGATYLIRVYDYVSGGGEFTICVTTPVPPMHYRTVQSGDFSNASTWETSPNNNDPWTAALQGPDVDDLSITIRSGDDVTISAGATLDQLTIASGSSLSITGGTLLVADGSGDDMVVFGTFINGSTILTSGNIIVSNGGKYQHNPPSSAGTIPSCTWESGSTCEILRTNNSKPNGLGQTFFDFIWNYPTQTSEVNLNGELDNIAGDFHLMNTGLSNLRMIGSGNTTTVGGNLIIDADAVLNLSGSTQNEIIQLSGNCTINGTLTELGTGSNSRIEFVGSGNGTISIGASGSIENTVNFVLNRTGSGDLTLGSDVSLPSTSSITFTDGLLHTGSFNLILLNTDPGSILGGSSASYLNGNLRQYIGFEDYTFPLGDANSYAPVSLGIINSGATYVDAKYDGDNPGISSGNSTCNNPSEEYTYTANCGSWVLTPNLTGTEQYNLTLVDAETCGLVTYTIAKNSVFDDCPSGFSKEFTSWSRFDLLGGPAGSPLPVELTQFDAVLDDGAIQLTWATASEINNDYFLVQHSTDGARFDDLGMVPGAGTTSQPQAYQWVHDRPAAGVNYYRLKQVDFDGQYEYSPIRVVDLRQETRGPQWSIRPTVTSDMLYLIRQGEGTGTAVWTVMTPAGRTAFSGSIAEGVENTPITVQSLPSGMYILRVSSREGVWSGRFWKE